jgi:multiple antibiotic resistance protein
MSVVLLTDNRSTPLVEQALTTGMITVVLLTTLCGLLLATRVHKVIGNAGSSIISRIMGLIVAAIALETGLDALEVRFGL